MISRACAPRSKRAFAAWAEATALPELMGFAAKDLDSQHFLGPNACPASEGAGRHRASDCARGHRHRTITTARLGLRHHQLLHPYRQHEHETRVATARAQQAGTPRSAPIGTGPGGGPGHAIAFGAFALRRGAFGHAYLCRLSQAGARTATRADLAAPAVDAGV